MAQSRKGIAQVNKTGWVYILDRVTGEPLSWYRREGGAPRAAPSHFCYSALPSWRRCCSSTSGYSSRRLSAGESRAESLRHFMASRGLLLTQGLQVLLTGLPAPMTRKGKPCSSVRRKTPDTILAGIRIMSLPKKATSSQAAPLVRLVSLPAALLLPWIWRLTRWSGAIRWEDRCYSGTTATAGGLVFVGS